MCKKCIPSAYPGIVLCDIPEQIYILYYILYLLRKNEDTIVKQAFRTSLELQCNGKNSFYHNLIKISEYYDLPDFDPNNLSEAKIKHYIDIIKQKYIAYW